MAGGGVGLTFSPLAVQARFSQADNRVAAVTGLNLFVRMSFIHFWLLSYFNMQT